MTTVKLSKVPSVAVGACVTLQHFQDRPPEGAALTDYDRQLMSKYFRLLDAAADGADWREAVAAIFGIDAAREPERARVVHDSHLARARWLAEKGYRDVVRPGTKSPDK